MIAPHWPRLRGRIGPWLRGEYDDRQYNSLFRFRNNVTGLKRLVLLKLLEHYEATDSQSNAEGFGQGGVVVFRNLPSRNDQIHFKEIVGHQNRIHQELRNVLRPKYLPEANPLPYVAVHVRMGDFRELTHDELLQGATNGRLPISWYSNIIESLRQRIGAFSVRLFSDGSNEALSPILRIPDVVRAPKQSSITDLLSIGNAKLVISSSSGFGSWGAYLGDSPRISYPGQMLEPVLENNLDFSREPECLNCHELDPRFIALVRSRLSI